MRKLSFIFLLTVCHCVVYSQSAKHKLHVIARSYGDSIVLRWAPSTAIAWETGNKNGYHVERYLIKKDTTLLTTVVREQLTHQAVKPLPLEEWQPIVTSNKYGALAAQALYGKTFQLSTGDTGASITQIYQKVKESDARFSLALFAADFSREVSVASALRLTDKNVKKGEHYLYRVYTIEANIKIDTAFCYVGTDDVFELPKPMDIQAHAEKGMAVITWNKNYFSDIYTAYFIERSDDEGKNYHTINDLPLVNTHSGDEAPDRGIFTDSIPQEGKTYFYRVRGMSSFAEQGPTSDSVAVKSIPPPAFTPELTEAIPFNNTEVHLRWSYPNEGETSIKEFRIEKGDKASGPFSVLKSGIKSSERTYVDKVPSSNAYYRISVLGLNQSERKSFPHLVQLIDSVAPLTPAQPVGIADSTGVVKLRWTKNLELDLKGYRVYRANFANDEYFQVTAGALKDTVFYDTINSKTLTRSAFYKIVALDNNFNPSPFSKPVMITRVDRISPTAPVFVSYQATDEGVLLQWKPSLSDDVKETILFRRIKGEKIWKPVSTLSMSTSTITFLDKEASSRNTYEYLLQAIDTSGLQSDENNIIVARRFDDGVRPIVVGVKGIPDRKNKKVLLSWEYPQGDVSKFQIYKKSTGGKLTLFATVSGSEKNYEDSALKVNTHYVYSIKAIWNDGGESPMSEMVTIKY